MGRMSNQWLNRGMGYRNRSYWPVHVKVNCRKLPAAPHGDRIEFTASRSSGECQTLFLSEAEVDAVASTVVMSMSPKRREHLVCSLLQGLSNAKLLRALAVDLRKRVRLPKKLR